MGFSVEVHGRTRAARIAPVHRFALQLLTALALIVVIGCGAQSGDQKSTSAQGAGGSKPTASTSTAKRAAKPDQAVTASHDAMPTGRATRVRLTAKGCVQFEPHWTTIHVGQSLSWHSDLKSPVTIHVSSGTFDKMQYVVRPGATVSTGPARNAGSFSIWTEPTACQDVPRGVQASGPGVMVEAR